MTPREMIVGRLELLARERGLSVMESETVYEPRYYRDGAVAANGRTVVEIRAMDQQPHQRGRFTITFDRSSLRYETGGNPATPSYVFYERPEEMDHFFADWVAAIERKEG